MSDLNKLAQHREALLLAEVAAWLHMLGKFHEDFLQGNHQLATEIPSDLATTHQNLNQLLRDTWTGAIWASIPIAEFDATNLSIYDFIKEHQNLGANSGLLRLMQDAHGRGSGIEKGALNRFAPGQSGNVHLATAVANETKAIESTELNQRRIELYSFLQEQLNLLRTNRAAVPWEKFRPQFIARLEQDFRTTVAETRRPLNDVTLFDQTIASVAFFKAALAQNLITNWQDPTQHKYHWRILRVGLDGLRYWGQVERMNDLISRKVLVDGALNDVRALLEETYPLGMEIYRDESGSLFIVSDIEHLLELEAYGKPLRQHLQGIAEQRFNYEALFTLKVSDRTRNTLSFGKLATEALPFPNPDLLEIEKWWQKSNGGEVCIVCGVRPQGYEKDGEVLNQKALQRNVCGTCERRRSERSKSWTLALHETIWINEAADATGRIALVVGKFGLEDWLSGKALNTALAFEPTERDLIDQKRNNKEYRFSYKAFQQGIETALSPQKAKQTLGKWVPVLDNLLLTDQRGGFQKFPGIYDLYVQDTDLNYSTREAWRFALALMRQQPAFARIRRIWETTRLFWQNWLPTEIIPRATERLQIIPENAEQLDLGHYHVYDLVLTRGVKLSVVWDLEKKRFITAENLDYISKPEQLGEDFKKWLEQRKGQRLTLEEPTGYGSTNREWGQIQIQNVENIPNSSYTPAIPILAEPRTFMALVPANKALEVMKAIKEKYEREMGKVRNRLPLHLGVVYAHRRTPLRTVLDAGRRMLKQSATPDGWKVTCVARENLDQGDKLPVRFQEGKAGQFKQWYEISLEKDNNQLTWYIPAVMGDGQTEDCWYPYVFLKTNNEPASRKRYFRAPNPFDKDSDGKPKNGWLVHARELKKDDVVYFTPATLDFEWLDTAARRFEIAYDGNGQRLDNVTKPYLLDDLETLNGIWETISNHLSKNQIYAVRDSIEMRREEWRPAVSDCTKNGMFWRFCRDVLANAQWQGRETNPGEKKMPWEVEGKDRVVWLDEWAIFAVRGWLNDVVELHLQIIKEEVKTENTNDRMKFPSMSS